MITSIKNRAITLLLALAMLVAMTPIIAVETYAEEASVIYVTELNQQPTVIYANQNKSGNGWRYDASEKILYLEDFTGEKIKADGNLKIVLSGDNNIVMPALPTEGNHQYGIHVTSGNLIIDSATRASDTLYIKCAPVPTSSAYYEGIRADYDVKIEGGVVGMDCTTPDSNRNSRFYFYGITAANGSTYVKNNAGLSIWVDAPNAKVIGVVRSLYAETENDIDIKIQAAPSNSSYAALNGYLRARGSGDIRLSYVNGKALEGRLLVSDGAGKITLDGIVDIENSDAAYYYHLPTGYKFTTPSTDVTFMHKDSSPYYPLCTSDGTIVTSSVIEKVGASNDPLRVVNTDNYDMKNLKLEQGYRGEYLNLAVLGGVGPYTWTATGLPDGLRLHQSVTPQTDYSDNHYGQYIEGTPTRAMPAGTATITVKDSTGAQVTMQISYDEIKELPKYITIDGTKINASENRTGTGWKYVAATKQITLDGYNGGPITSDDVPLSFELKGNNVINMPTTPSSSSSTIYGLYCGKGDITINASTGTTSDKLKVKCEPLMTSGNYTYFHGICADTNLIINSGAVSVEFDENSSTTREYSVTGTTARSGQTYVKGSSTLGVNFDIPHCSSANGIVRALYAQTSGDINVNINAQPSNSYYYAALNGWLVATGTGSCSFSYPGGVAASGRLDISNTVGDIYFEGIVELYSDAIYYYHLPEGYKFTTPSENVIFKETTIGSRDMTVLCKTDGTVVQEARIQKVGAANDPLTFTDFADFDITGAQVGKSYRGIYINGAVVGGVGPYTWEAEGLPEGLQLLQSVTPQRYYSESRYDQYIYGTPTAETPAGVATIKVTDANGTTKSIQINYNSMYTGEPDTGISIDKTTMTLTYGDSTGQTLTASVLPANASHKEVNWSSAGNSVYIDAQGNTATVTPRQPGISTVTASSFGGFSKSCRVIVKERTPTIAIRVTGATDGYLDGFSSRDTYTISSGGSSICTVSGVYSIPITNEMKGKTLDIVALNKDNAECNSAPQHLFVPETMERTDISGMTVTGIASSYVYTGSQIRPEPSIEGLENGKDFYVNYKDNKDVGTATVIIEGMGAYRETITKTFNITAKSVTEVTVTGVSANYTYTGSNIKPTPIVKDGTKTLEPNVDYLVDYATNTKDAGEKKIAILGRGNYNGSKYVRYTINPKPISGGSIEGIADSYECTDAEIEPAPTVKVDGVTLVAGTDYYVTYTNNVEVGTATVTVTGKGNYKGTLETTFVIEESSRAPIRIAGTSRYDTALDAATYFKTLNKLGKLDTIIVACGANYPDALTGSYLAKKKNAPIILVDTAVEGKIVSYIKDNVKPGGTVYLLGGTGAVSANFQKSLDNAGFDTNRLGGANRFDTNLRILNEAGISSEDLLICSSNGYADSLSASATGLPIMLVGDSLTKSQKDFIAGISTTRAYAIGGEGAVSKKVMGEVKAAGINTVDRVAGASRYQTSVEVAKKFFPGSKKVVLAYAQNFPDGLSGGPIAMCSSMNAPLILVSNASYSDAKTWCNAQGCRTVVVMGGAALISDAVAASMMG